MALRSWWTRKYNLPANHELFVSQSIAELTLEQFEDFYQRRSELEASLDKLTGDAFKEATSRLRDINEALEEADSSEDPLIDKWERELAEGKTPDLTER